MYALLTGIIPEPHRRRVSARPLLAEARVIAATFALQQALPAARNGDKASPHDGLREYR
jgi:hypothetical protein